MTDLVLIVDNVRSALNVGSLLRTAEGLGVNQVILTGYTPYPKSEKDDRLPHLAQKIDARIKKTALGAEQLVSWRRTESIGEVITELKAAGYEIAALEQSTNAVPLNEYKPAKPAALIVGNEVGGISQTVLQTADVILEIPMHGRKESFNVSAAAAMALYHLTSLDNQNL